MNKEILRKLFKGECSEEEVKKILTQLHSDKAEEFISDSLLDDWSEFDTENDNSELSEHIRKRVWDQIFNELPTKYHVSFKPRTRTGLTLFYKIAAAIIIGIISLIGFFYFNTISQDTSAIEVVKMIKKENPKGQKSRIYLPDGTVVWLNSESELIYPESFNDSVRLVKLKGEAYFEVAKKPDKPFIVETGQTSTKVLGTIFNINSFPENNGVTLSLIEGKISFKFREGQVEVGRTLNTGEGVYAPIDGQELDVFQFNPEEFVKWNEGILTFDKANINTVVFNLERWYGVNIKVENSTNQSWSFSGTFDNENLSNVLMNLSKMRNFTYEINGKDVSIKF